jgi:methyl-accepting chemotaxis protein
MGKKIIAYFDESFSLQVKILVAFLFIGILPLIFIAIVANRVADESYQAAISYQVKLEQENHKKSLEGFLTTTRVGTSHLVQALEQMREDSFRNLKGMHKIKKSSLEKHFRSIRQNTTQIAQSMFVQEAYRQMNEAFQEEPSGAKWQKVTKQYSSWLKNYTKEMFSQLYFVQPDGTIIFSTSENWKAGANLLDQEIPAKMKQCFLAAKESYSFVDFSYVEKENRAVAFVGHPIPHIASNGTLLFSINTNNINEIVFQRLGLRKTGESFLVGADQLMRSDAFLWCIAQ